MKKQVEGSEPHVKRMNEKNGQKELNSIYLPLLASAHGLSEIRSELQL